MVTINTQQYERIGRWTDPSAYEKGLPGLPGKSLGVGLKMVSDSKLEK